jgi:Domain of unknown function (DUF4382)
MHRMCRALVGVAASALLFAACSSSPSSPSAGSNLTIMLKDSPFSDAKALLVTFSEVSAHVSGTGGFTPIPFSGGATSRTCDLKKLAAATDVLGTGSLTPGHYTQLRLTVSSAILDFDSASSGAACQPSIAPAGKNTANVTIPSGQLILNREFDVTQNGATTITLDFDGDQSVHSQGNGQYNMTPVIAVVGVQ